MRTVSAAEIEKVVKRLQERDGVCSPQAFVGEAREADSPIHGLFDWDDAGPAELWRIHQARGIIGRVRITLKGRETPANVHVTITRDGAQREGYVGIEVAMSDVDMRAQIFREARAGLAGWQRRLAAFTEAEHAVNLLGQAIEALGGGDST